MIPPTSLPPPFPPPISLSLTNPMLVPTSVKLYKHECERACELRLLPIRPGALEEEDMEEFVEDGIINAGGEARQTMV